MQSNKQINCPDCQKSLQPSNIKQHIKNCKKYHHKFIKDALSISQYLSQTQLKFLLAQLDLAKQIILNKPQLNENNKQNIIKNGIHQRQQYPKQLIQCVNCKKQLEDTIIQDYIYADNCLHVHCIDCIKSYIEGQYLNKQGILACLKPKCQQLIPPSQIEDILGKQNTQKLSKKLLRKLYNLTICCKCNQEYQFIKGNSRDAPKKNLKGINISTIAAQHYAKNRFVCPNQFCKQQQCKQCNSVPYHLGYTCSQFKKMQVLKKCRYCQQPLQSGYHKSNGIKAFDDICHRKQCQIKVKNACAKILKCGHSCFGIINQKQCLPCLNQKCALLNQSQLHGQNQNSFCNICFIDGLKGMPCVQSYCGHLFHYQCIQKQLKTRWITPRIFFNFCLCPICKKLLQFAPESPLAPQLKQFKELFNVLTEKALQRLKYQGADKDEKLTNQKSQYFQKPEQYAMAIYAYFECYHCKKPYFGGRKSCAQAMNDSKNNSQFDPKQLVCPKCCPVSIDNCQKHGKQLIQFKCKFCCSVSQWFCWGSTHFCDDCHKKQESGTYVSKLGKDKLPKCLGPGKCPIGGQHDGNGTQRSLGCALCRQFKFSNHDF